MLLLHDTRHAHSPAAYGRSHARRAASVEIREQRRMAVAHAKRQYKSRNIRNCIASPLPALRRTTARAIAGRPSPASEFWQAGREVRLRHGRQAAACDEIMSAMSPPRCRDIRCDAPRYAPETFDVAPYTTIRRKLLPMFERQSARQSSAAPTSRLHDVHLRATGDATAGVATVSAAHARITLAETPARLPPAV